MKTIRRCRHFLQVLKTANPSLRKAIVRHASKDVIRAISEICLNTLNGNLNLNTKKKNLLKPYKKVLRQLASAKIKYNRKRRILQQKGGFLGILLSTILSGIIGSLINHG